MNDGIHAFNGVIPGQEWIDRPSKSWRLNLKLLLIDWSELQKKKENGLCGHIENKEMACYSFNKWLVWT